MFFDDTFLTVFKVTHLTGFLKLHFTHYIKKNIVLWILEFFLCFTLVLDYFKTIICDSQLGCHFISVLLLMVPNIVIVSHVRVPPEFFFAFEEHCTSLRGFLVSILSSVSQKTVPRAIYGEILWKSLVYT